MIAIITGGRAYTPTPMDHAWLDAVHAADPMTHVYAGGAPGADTDGAQWALRHAIPTTIVPANWPAHGKSAGPRRNRVLLEMAGPTAVVLAFPGGPGTANMVAQARQRGMPVWESPSRATQGGTTDHEVLL